MNGKISWQLVVVLAILIICTTILAVFSGDTEIFKYVITAVLSFLGGLGTGVYITWKALKGG